MLPRRGIGQRARGFALASHDSGHIGAVFDGSFMADQRASLDFAKSSVRVVTEMAKAMTIGYYGKPISRSYMADARPGGRESMLAAQRYPELFDGIVVGAPGNAGRVIRTSARLGGCPVQSGGAA